MQKTTFTHIRPCQHCGGSGTTMGTVMQIECTPCAGLGFFGPCTEGDHMPSRYQLACEVRRLAGLINSKPVAGVHAENARGVGGSMWTGD